MNPTTAILQALQNGADHKELLAILCRYKAAGMSQRETYDLLEGIWKDLGFDLDDSDEVDPRRNTLEYVMEVVWGYCPRTAALWEAPLTNE